MCSCFREGEMERSNFECYNIDVGLVKRACVDARTQPSCLTGNEAEKIGVVRRRHTNRSRPTLSCSFGRWTSSTVTRRGVFSWPASRPLKTPNCVCHRKHCSATRPTLGSQYAEEESSVEAVYGYSVPHQSRFSPSGPRLATFSFIAR